MGNIVNSFGINPDEINSLINILWHGLYDEDHVSDILLFLITHSNEDSRSGFIESFLAQPNSLEALFYIISIANGERVRVLALSFIFVLLKVNLLRF
jgi:hypothetical protein